MKGLTPALDYRERAGKMTADTAESYRRVSKAIVQNRSGRRAHSSSHYERRSGWHLEIVPERSPYAANQR